MYDYFLFAGTTEGRQIADALGQMPVRTVVFTATEYGGSLIREDLLTKGEATSDGSSSGITVESRRMDEAEMRDYFRANASSGSLVIDATHPYAEAVTENIRKACEEADLPYIRVLRDDTLDQEQLSEDEVHMVASPEEAAAWLSQREGNILLTTGSKELAAFTSIPDYKSRVYARVLSLPKVAAACSELGFQGKNLICMQGPFSEEMNIALIHHAKAKYLVTKDTGKEGGFPEKVSAARKCGCILVIITRPDPDEKGISIRECLYRIRKNEVSL